MTINFIPLDTHFCPLSFPSLHSVPSSPFFDPSPSSNLLIVALLVPPFSLSNRSLSLHSHPLPSLYFFPLTTNPRSLPSFVPLPFFLPSLYFLLCVPSLSLAFSLPLSWTQLAWSQAAPGGSVSQAPPRSLSHAISDQSSKSGRRHKLLQGELNRKL